MSGNIARRVLTTFYRPTTSPRCGAPVRATIPATCPEIFRQAASVPRRAGVSFLSSGTLNHTLSPNIAAGGSLAAGCKPSPSVAQELTSPCANATGETRVSSHRTLDRRKVTYQLQGAKPRPFHSSARQKSSPQSGEDGESSKKTRQDGKDKIGTDKGAVASKATQRTTKGLAAASAVNKHVMDRLPSMPHIHRPNKEELLAAATGFWSRLKVRFKWFSIRSVRPFNMDEIGAFFSWFVLGHVIWIIVGTTTFFSLAIFAVNTVFAQGNPYEYDVPMNRG